MAILLTKVSGHAILVNDDDKVLLLQNIHHADGREVRTVMDKYIFPGGRLEEGEQPEVALLREIKEETGLTNVKILMPVHSSIWGRTNPRFSVMYLARVTGNEPIVIQPDEAASYKWATWDEAGATAMINEQFHVALRKARALWAIPQIKSD